VRAPLKHVRCPLPGGGQVIVLDTGARVGSEAVAMLQALYSRSVGSVVQHLEMVERPGGAEKFMSTYYVGYGHKSIGDCGDTIIFIEGVSMLAAKAIQDSRLYNGQESSTRYINFAEQQFCDPIGTKDSSLILERWRTAYLSAYEQVLARLTHEHPLREGEKETAHKKALAARAFDIVRSLLPAGASTNLAWNTTLRHAADHLLTLRHHPLEEVRAVAGALEDALPEAHPSSFTKKRYDATEQYMADAMVHYYYEARDDTGDDFVTLAHNGLRADLLRQHGVALARRPPKTELPKYIAECGTLQMRFLLDFGSFRDLQRHRSVHQRMPLLTAARGFAPWYLEQLPQETHQAIAEQMSAIQKLGAPPEVLQYYLPMGYRVSCQITGDIPSLVYIAELRSGETVHPTLRHVAQQIGTLLEEICGPYGLQLHMDAKPDRFSVKRGTQDIVMRDDS